MCFVFRFFFSGSVCKRLSPNRLFLDKRWFLPLLSCRNRKTYQSILFQREFFPFQMAAMFHLIEAPKIYVCGRKSLPSYVDGLVAYIYTRPNFAKWNWCERYTNGLICLCRDNPVYTRRILSCVFLSFFLIPVIVKSHLKRRKKKGILLARRGLEKRKSQSEN